jgi:hypothetical protein
MPYKNHPKLDVRKAYTEFRRKDILTQAGGYGGVFSDDPGSWLA